MQWMIVLMLIISTIGFLQIFDSLDKINDKLARLNREYSDYE